MLPAFYSAIKQADKATLYVLIAVFSLILILWGFAELADEVLEGETHRIDAMILALFRHRHDLAVPVGPPWVLLAARDITALGGHTVLTLVALIAAGYCLILRQFGTMGLVIAASAGGGALSTLLKWAFNRTRPDIVPHLVEVSSLSFPSGHAMISAAIYLSLAAIVAQITPRRRARLYILSIALVLTGLIGISRIYLGVHYPSDVLAGWAIGLSWAIACWLLAFYFRKTRMQKPE